MNHLRILFLLIELPLMLALMQQVEHRLQRRG
jgi:hypothetical protein